MRKRIWSAILALSMLLTLAPAASAANSLTIDLTNGSIAVSESNGIMTVVQGDSTSTCTGLFVTGGTIDEPTANTISVTGGNVALTIKDVHIQATDNTSPISVSDGSLALTLGGISRNVLDASTSKGNASKAGISLASGTSLTIDDGGYAYLIVNGGEWAAAIGGDMGRSGGNITINGGTIEANGGTYGAGIGGGYSGVTPAEDLVAGSGGTITINGGEIQAVSSAGAGIGGGRYGNGGTVTINGGTVRAASAYGAGIGGGQNGYGGYVKIGADVKSVTAEGYCTAIGGGKAGNEYGCTDLIIKDISKVETAVALETGTPFAERFYNNILYNDVTETNIGYAWDHGELKALARSGESGYPSDGTCTWLWQWSADGETDWTDVAYSAYHDFSNREEPDENKYYRCTITNEFGNSIISPVGRILPLEITSQPQDAVAEQGETAKFSVETNCNEAVVYWYWQQRFNGGEWTMIAGATTNTLTVTADEDGWEYRCMMEDWCGDVGYTDAATLTIGTEEEEDYSNTFFIAPDASPETVVTEYAIAEGSNYFYYDNLTTEDDDANFDEDEDIGAADIFYYDAACTQAVSTDIINLDDILERGALQVVLKDAANFPADGVYMAARKDDGTVVQKLHLTLFPANGTAAAPQGLSYRLLDEDNQPTGNYLAGPIEIPTTAGVYLALYFNGEIVSDEDLVVDDTIRLKPLWDEDEEDPTGCYRLIFRNITETKNGEIAFDLSATSQPGRSGRAITAVPVRPAYGFYTDADPTGDYSSLVEEIEVPEGGKKTVYLYSENPAGSVTIALDGAIIASGALGNPYPVTIDADDILAKGSHLIAQAPGILSAELEIYLAEEEETAPADTLCWRGIEKCGGNVFEPTGEYSTEPITVHGTNTRRVVFYYGDVMLEPDELTFSEHSGLTIEEIEGENEDGEAFTHFRILSENGADFTDQTVSYNGQSITLSFEETVTIPDGLCYTLVTAVEDENGEVQYVDGAYRTTEISIPSRDQVNIRVYYNGELIESVKELELSENLRFKTVESDDDTFGCFKLYFKDITDDTVQTFAHADDPDDTIDVRPNIPPYGFYTEAEPILANLTEELTIEAGGTGTVYFYDVTNEADYTPALWFEGAPKGVSFGELKRLANNMISVSVSVADTVAAGEFALMATGFDTAELTITVVTETVLDLRDGSIVLYAEEEDEVEAVQTLSDGTKKYYYASAFIVTSGGEATSNTITVADGTAPLTLRNCRISNGTAPLIDVREGAELQLTVSENSVLNVQSSDFAAIHVPDEAEFHYFGGSLEILTGGKGAGIGGSVGEGCGTIYIEGGSLNIGSIGQASGIGCGANGSGGLVNIDAAEICIENLGSAGSFGIGGGLNDNAYALDRVILGDDADIKAYDADGNQLKLDGGLVCQERIDVDPLADTVKNYGYHAKGTSKSGDLTYQWQKLTSGAWTDVEGATEPDLTVESSDSGTYRCALTNIYGNTVYTNDATRLSTTGAVVLDLADGPIVVRSNGGFNAYDTGFVVYATQNGQSYSNGGGPYGGKLIVVQSTETTTNTITSYDGRVPMIAINLCIETETGPAISVTGGKLDLTLSGVNEFSSPDSPAIHVTRGSQSYPLNITGDGNAELYASTGSNTAAAIGSGENEYAGGVSLYNVKGSIRGGLHAIGSGSESAEYGCYYLSISNCPDLERKAGKRDVVLQERITAGALEKTVLWSGAIKASVTYPTSNVTYQWERSSDGVTWETIKGAAAAEHIVEPIYSGWYHRCIVTNTYGNELVVGPGQMYCLMITEQPAPAVATSGAQAAFTAKTNADAKNWLWQVSTDGGTSWSTVGTQQTGGAESTLTLTAEEAMNGNLYRCRIADSSSAYAYTEPAALTIAKPMPYTLDSIVLRDQSTNAVLDAIPSGSFLAELTFTNVSADAAATFLLVTYDADGMMLDMGYCIAFPDVGRSMTWGALIRNDGSAARIQAMALSSLGELIPVAESIEYP